ncbi:luciferin sulfotransferase-like [Hetaerina americana]|uniref:luciferin sulfotransferase-like n=1 Tax=Hetaerina americana TaxID=62018 RepID=UPI003A7F446D
MGTRTEQVVAGTKANDILLRDFTSQFRSGYKRVFPSGDGGKRSGKGYLLPDYFSDYEKQIREMEIRPDDIWVASYPKTGTTWTQEMVWCIGNDLDFERAKSIVLPLRFPFIDLSCLFNFPDGPKAGLDSPLFEFLKDSVKYTVDKESPRYIKTHLPWELLPEQIKTKKAKVIYVARNPKDTCVSYYHHSRLIEGYRGSFEDFIELFLQDTVTYSPFWDHLLSYWEHRDDSNVLFLKYEEMKKDLPSVIRKVSTFMGKKQLNDEDMKTLCHHLSFESMKSNGSVNYEFAVDKTQNLGLSEGDQHFMRKGKVNSWKEEISPEVAERFDAWIENNLNGLNLHAESSFMKWVAGKI